MKTFWQIRKKLHNMDWTPPRNIFLTQSIKNAERYAFHYGGRKELQYNIGYITKNKEELFRYGIAFSFEENRNLKDYKIFKNRFNQFIEYLKINKSKLADYELYYHAEDREDGDFISIDKLSMKFFKEDMFIFFGKTTPPDKIDFDKVLETFDQLLEIYIYIEGANELDKSGITIVTRRKDKVDITKRAEIALRKITARTSESDLRHNKIQKKINHILSKKYGKENVYPEDHTDTRTRIDFVIDSSELIYYEIKTYPLIRLCIRKAIGQLIEYAYWSNKKKPDKLIIISENPITDDAKEFLHKLRKEINLNVYYQQFDFEDNTLSELY